MSLGYVPENIGFNCKMVKLSKHVSNVATSRGRISLYSGFGKRGCCQKQLTVNLVDKEKLDSETM
jgi:hypothetical protein